jgi:hypothetical protein
MREYTAPTTVCAPPPPPPRSRLSYETFAAFLAAIKDLNGGRATREETQRRARHLFGAANADLAALFESVLSRHVAS